MDQLDISQQNLSRKSLSSIFNSLNEGLLLVDRNRRIVFFNDYLQKFLEIYNTEDLLFEDAIKLTRKDQKVDVAQICPELEVQSNGLIFTEKALFIETTKGETKLVKVSSYRYKEFFDNNISCLITISDDTKEQELEKMKIDFASQSVHILRTPVSIIRNNIDFLKRESFQSKLDEKEKEFIKGLAEGADRLQNIVETMISLNEIQNEKIKLILESTSLFSLTREVVKELSPKATNKNLKIYLIEPLYDIPNIRIDSLKIYDVLSGIINNAIKFTSEGEITITFEKDIKNVILKVKDTGKGIPDIGLKNIFNKFYHYKTSALNMEEGLGIGLYISKKIIESHNGSIKVESFNSQGTTVTITLPLN